MHERKKGHSIAVAAARAGMSRKTASKYLRSGQLPSEGTQHRTYRTRPDPFDADWPWLVERLELAPTLEAKGLFAYLLETRPGYNPGQLRTFQRKVRRWRALEGPPKEVFFSQVHKPGEAIQVDFTWMTKLNITIQGVAFAHMLCIATLPYSRASWMTISLSESLVAIKHGIQEALFALGKRTEYVQTDNSTAATHHLPGGKREFNEAYVRFVADFEMKPRTIAVGQSNQNGSVEATNGAWKRRIEQHLLIRQSRDFDSVVAYQAWLNDLSTAMNATRPRLEEELAAMKPLTKERLPTWTTVQATVSSWSTVRIRHNAYSVPSRLIGERVDVRVYDDRIEVYFQGVLQLSAPRLLGRNGHHISYRHIIWWLIRKPGAFERYRYREDLFPSLVFRRCYDALVEHHSTVRRADIAYLRLLHLAASTMEEEVETALSLLLEANKPPTADAVKSLTQTAIHQTPALTSFEANPAEYDALLKEVS